MCIFNDNILGKEQVFVNLLYFQTLTSKGGLRTHKRCHQESESGKKKFSCDECDYQCHQLYLLKRHKVRYFTARQYRVTLVVAYIGWDDLHLGSSPGWWAATVATYCPSRMVEPPK